MSSVDYVSALGAGAGIDSKAIVNALVEAERAPQQSSLDRPSAEYGWNRYCWNRWRLGIDSCSLWIERVSRFFDWVQYARISCQ